MKYLIMAAISNESIEVESMDPKSFYEVMDPGFKSDINETIDTICEERGLNYTEDSNRSEIINYLISEYEGTDQLGDVNLDTIFGLAIDDKNGFRSVSNRSTPRNFDGRLSRASSKSATGDHVKINVGGVRCEFEVCGVTNDSNIQQLAYYLKIIKILPNQKETDQYQIFVENGIDLEKDNIKIRLFTGKSDISKKMKELYESINASGKKFNSIVMEGIFHKFTLTYDRYKIHAMVTSWCDQIRIVDKKYKEKPNHYGNFSGSALSGTKASWGNKNESAESLEEQLRRLKELTAKTEKRIAERQFQKKYKSEIDEINLAYKVETDEAEAAFGEASEKFKKEKEKRKKRMEQAKIDRIAKIEELSKKNKKSDE